LIRYWPVPSVAVDRARSMSAGLAASTVTPGSTPPDVSRTAPARLCAAASLISNVIQADKRSDVMAARMTESEL
jgi:hypothetical protein